MKILVVVDMQNDFIDGSLGTKEAQAIVPKVVDKINNFEGDLIIATQDTHYSNYLETNEGKRLPVEHCLYGEPGWDINDDIFNLILGKEFRLINKQTFGTNALPNLISMETLSNEPLEIELVGLCTDICVVTNALLLKTAFPNALISVDSSCCAGVTPESHEAALTTMKMCQIEVK